MTNRPADWLQTFKLQNIRCSSSSKGERQSTSLLWPIPCPDHRRATLRHSAQ
ncbi:hypothetical protein CHARACLAT_023979, partial [Characodon lateralis]|nr:hypothetical protein [Characodon lateralis]